MPVRKHFPYYPEYVPHEFYLNHTKKYQMVCADKWDFFALSELVNFIIQLLELVENSVEVP